MLARMPGDPNISRLLAEWALPDGAARDEVVALVYDELRRIAHRYLKGERPGHTLQTTALVNEAYLRIVELDRMQWKDRAHFFAMAATLMRRILVDYARQRGRGKRGAGVQVLSLDGHDVAAAGGVDIEALDRALERLAALDAQQARRRSPVVAMRGPGAEIQHFAMREPDAETRHWSSPRSVPDIAIR
jgi:RNA polymerase sigma factor (TIGR02999 family)